MLQYVVATPRTVLVLYAEAGFMMQVILKLFFTYIMVHWEGVAIGIDMGIKQYLGIILFIICLLKIILKIIIILRLYIFYI